MAKRKAVSAERSDSDSVAFPFAPCALRALLIDDILGPSLLDLIEGAKGYARQSRDIEMSGLKSERFEPDVIAPAR